MALTELILAANEHYPDGFLLAYFDERTGREKKGHGDTLAFSIVSNLVETYDAAMTDKEQRRVAVDVIDNLIEDLTRVSRGLQEYKPEEMGLFDE